MTNPARRGGAGRAARARSTRGRPACCSRTAGAYKAEKRSSRSSRTTRESHGSSAAESRSGRSRAAGEAASRDAAVAPPLDAYHARRYNDMAPKHWEEGPPRYLGTEYERPPPYYYPGPHDRQ
ncbi:hypothetical protein PYW07_016834 [Mythimna separata]|uniref:Uncharacterized protein n=1 Tax=Mythimna separata TaxID=271217 RepID=A0AAD7YV83_MYTSE|nr:hypothetical protein PYW07_016834 [Mythimna separata]